jgi:hypothetical protein
MFSAQNSQDEERGFKERLRFGGDMILTFGTVTALGGSPWIGYEVSPRYVPGIGLTYIYFSANGTEAHQTGIRNFHRFMVTQELFLHAEAEYLRFRSNDRTEIEDSIIEIPRLLVGGGIRQPLGGNSFMMFSVLYDLIQDPDSPFVGPIIRGGVSLGR